MLTSGLVIPPGRNPLVTVASTQLLKIHLHCMTGTRIAILDIRPPNRLQNIYQWRLDIKGHIKYEVGEHWGPNISKDFTKYKVFVWHKPVNCNPMVLFLNTNQQMNPLKYTRHVKAKQPYLIRSNRHMISLDVMYNHTTSTFFFSLKHISSSFKYHSHYIP